MKLNKYGVTAASLVVLAFGSASAFAGAMGTVNIGTGYTWQDVDDAQDQDEEFMNLFIGGKVNIPYSQTVNLQLDAFGDAAYGNEGDDNNYGTGIGVGAHVNYRDDRGLLGIFAATGRSASIDEDTSSFFAAGFEGQWYCDQWTFLGQIGYLDSGEDEDAGDAIDGFNNAGFARIGVDYYASKRLKLSGEVSYADGEQEDDDATLWEWKAGVEYLFSTAVPSSVYLEYRGAKTEETGSNDELQNHALNLGVRFQFGATDLMHSDRSGASASLPGFQRWVNEAGEAID